MYLATFTRPIAEEFIYAVATRMGRVQIQLTKVDRLSVELTAWHISATNALDGTQAINARRVVQRLELVQKPKERMPTKAAMAKEERRAVNGETQRN